MLRLFIVCIITTSSLYNFSFGQEFLKSVPYHLNKNENSSEIQSTISEKSKVYSSSEIDKFKLELNKYNKSLNREIELNKDKRQKLLDVYQEIIKNEGVAKISKQIDILKQTKQKLTGQLETNLEDISVEGLFIYYKKGFNSITSNKTKLANGAISAITPYAVETLNGTWVKSTTDIFNKNGISENFYQQITTEINGSMNIKSKYTEGIDYNNSLFWYVCSVNVLPLKESIKLNNVNSKKTNRSEIIIDAVSEENISQKLQKFGASQKSIDEILKIVQKNRSSIIRSNQTSRRRKEIIISDGKDKIDNIQYQIDNLTLKYKKSVNSLNKLAFIYSGRELDINNIQSSTNSLLNIISEKIKANQNNELELYEQELIAEWNIPVSSESDQSKAIADKVLEIKEKLNQTYGKKEHYTEIVKINKSESSSNTSENFNWLKGENRSFNRKVSDIWFFPVPKQNSWEIGVLVRFKYNNNKTDISSKFEEIEIKCSDCGRSDKDNFRVMSTGSSSNPVIAQEKALLNAISELSDIIEAKVESVSSKYADTLTTDSNKNIGMQDQQMSRNIINTINSDIKIICSELTKNQNNIYTHYIAIELSKEDLLNRQYKKNSKEKIDKIKFDEKKFKEFFDKEMKKLSK